MAVPMVVPDSNLDKTVVQGEISRVRNSTDARFFASTREDSSNDRSSQWFTIKLLFCNVN